MALTQGRRALVFCDIEGGEFSLFTPPVIAALQGCDVFIELHGTPQENSSFIQRFGERSGAVVEHPVELAGAERISFMGADASSVAKEYRERQQWLVLKPSDVSSLERLRESLRQPALTVPPEPVEVRLTPS